MSTLAERSVVYMKTLSIIFLFLASVIAQGYSESGSDLKLFASISDAGTNGWLHMRITNCGDKEQTILTDNFTIWSLGGSSIRGTGIYRKPEVWVRFEILTMGTLDNPEEWKFIPSLPKLGPVTLRNGESAEIKSLELDPDFMEVIRNDPERLIPISYTIEDDIAERFGLWHGTLVIKESAKSLLNK